MSHRPTLYNLSFNTPADILTYAAAFNAGDLCYVASLDGVFYYDPTPTLALDGTMVLASADGDGAWISLEGSYPPIDANHIYVYHAYETASPLANSGSGPNGALVFQGLAGEAAFASRRLGRRKSSVRAIAGVGFYSSNTAVVPAGAVTIEIFAACDVIPANNAEAFYVTDGAGRVFAIGVSNTTTPHWYAKCVEDGTATTVATTTPLIDYNTPQHVMASYSQADGLKLYVDGVLAASAAGVSAFSQKSIVGLGNYSAAFRGWVTEARVSNILRSSAYALQTAEQLYRM